MKVIPVTDIVGDGAQDDSASVQPNQSYLVKQMQYEIAKQLTPMIAELATGRGPKGHTLEDGQPGWLLKPPSKWRKDNQVFDYHHIGSLRFENARFDPEHSNIQYGPKRVAANVAVNVDEKTKLIKAGTDISVSYEESVDLTNSFSTAISQGMTLDISSKVSSETTVSGTYAGVSAEEKVSAEFGVDVSKSKEEEQEKSEEGTESEKLSIEFDAKAGNNYLVTISKEHETTYQDFVIDGVMDFDIRIDYNLWVYVKKVDAFVPRHHTKTVEVQGIAGFEQYVHGYDTNYPELKGYWKRALERSRAGIEWTLDPKHRVLSVRGTNQASLENNATYNVEPLGNMIPDDYKHIPIIDAEGLDGIPS